MARRIRITKKTPWWMLLIIAAVSLAQYFNWLQPATEKLVPIEPGYYRVTSVADGDTIAVDMNGRTETIRMIGVDTPETQDPRKAVQCFGQAASDFTKGLVRDSTVRLEADSQSSNRDRYNRLLRYVYLPDNRLLQAEIIRQGYGFAYTSFPFAKANEFRILERQAREANSGLWGNCEVQGTSTSRSTNPVE